MANAAWLILLFQHYAASAFPLNHLLNQNKKYVTLSLVKYNNNACVYNSVALAKDCWRGGIRTPA